MRVITPASRAVVVSARDRAEKHIRRVLFLIEPDEDADEQARELRAALAALREIEIEIAPA